MCMIYAEKMTNSNPWPILKKQKAKHNFDLMSKNTVKEHVFTEFRLIRNL